MAIRLAALRARTHGERLLMVFEMTEFAVKMSEAGLRVRHPEASEREIFLRSAALRLPRDLMIRAYGCDPEPGFKDNGQTL